MNSRFHPLLASSILAAAFVAPAAFGHGQLGPPSLVSLGSFGGISYVQYDGVFEGETSTGAYRVPYRITAPARPVRGNKVVVVEPSHFVAGLGAMNFHLGRGFLFSRGFAHAGVGWSTASGGPGENLRILDPSVPGTFVEGGFEQSAGRTDDEILADFGHALAVDANAAMMLGDVQYRYLVGFSDSSNPVLRLVTSGDAAGVYDLVLAYTAQGHDPQSALAAGIFEGKLVIVNSEFETAGEFIDEGEFPGRYRFYAVAGTPHIPDDLLPSFASGTTPASFHPALRAHFLQGHQWVKSNKRPPPSTRLLTTVDEELARDENGNAISVNGDGQDVPRLPFVELGEATFLTGFLGRYENVKTIHELGFLSHREYLKAFRDRLAAYAKAGYMAKEDADATYRRAALCPPLTFTETYRDHYEAFAAIAPCGP